MDTLRYYQIDAIDAVLQHPPEEGHPLVVAPTGSGKTHIIGGLCEAMPGKNILILSHVKEILMQNAEKLKKYVPPNKVGIYSSGLGKRQKYKYCVAGIQSVYKRAAEFKKYDVIIVDECHLIPVTGEGRYRTFLGKMSHALIIGLTATPFRLGTGYITEGHIFSKVVYDIDLIRLIKEGYLCKLTTKQPKYVLDTTGVKVIGGDFSKKDLSNKLDTTQVTNHVVQELVSNFKDKRKSWLIFAIDIAHAESITKQLSNLGVVAAAVHSQMELDRGHFLDLFKAGHIQAIVSIETLTTGFDAPNIDLITLLRPTQSPVLHVQMIGRGLRPNENKEDCLILDFAGNTARLGPINDVRIKVKGKGKGKGGALVRVCANCNEVVSIKVKTCPACFTKFPEVVKITEIADEVPVIAEKKTIKDKLKIREHQVDRIHYMKHHKPGKIPSLKITYTSKLRSFSEWKAFEHGGYPRISAKNWWNYMAPGTIVPKTVDEALLRRSELKQPKTIFVKESGKFPEIIRYEF